MNNQDFTASFHVSEAPQVVFDKIMNVRGWWSGLYGEEIQDEPDGGFSFRAGSGAHYSRQKPVEMVPGKKIVWLVTDSKLTFANDPEEWTGTKIGFELTPEGTGTKIIFTHAGLVPELDCFDQCTAGWSRYLHERFLPLFNSSTPVA